MVPLLRFQLKPMKKNSWIPLVLLFAFNLSVNAQEKKWTLEECVTYALDHNISIKQTALDTETATIDKKGAIGNFLPSFNANASHSCCKCFFTGSF